MENQDIGNKGKLVENLQTAIDAEQTASSCFGYIASLIKNGRIRAKFYSFVESAKKNKALLTGCLNNAGVTDFVLVDKCKFCKLKPESFSLFGALNLGLEITNASIKVYNDLLGLKLPAQDKSIFKELLKEKTQQRSFLKKEKKFAQDDKAKAEFINRYCIPEVIAKLWK